jgi:hypothetical protein
MSLEKNIERIADALEALVSQGRSIPATLETTKLALGGDITLTDEPPLGGKAEGPAKKETQQPPAGVELDEGGLPWDKRIHSGSKTKLVNGNWKKLRNVAAALVATVEAEIRAGLQTGAPVIPDSSIPAGVQTQVPAGAMSLADLQIAAQDVVRQLGPRLNEVAVVLQKYGASELSGLAAEQYTNFLGEIKALLDPPA